MTAAIHEFTCPRCDFRVEARATEATHICKAAPKGSGGRVALTSSSTDAGTR